MVFRYKDIHAFDNSKTMEIIYSMTEQVRSPYIEHAASGLPNPTRFGGGWGAGVGGTICPGSRPSGVTTRCPRIQTECFLTRSMLIKMYKFTISGYVPVYVSYLQSVSFMQTFTQSI